jgi:ABC-type molybdate transport system substrate-binding protein
VIFTEEAENRIKAKELEKYYKSGCGKEILKNKKLVP